MANLYITEQNSVLRKSGERLILQKDEETLLEVQCHKIDAVLIFGNVQFTTQAVTKLFEHGIELAILSKTGRIKGHLVSPLTKNIELRVVQFRRYEDDDFRLNFAKTIMTGKLANSLSVVRKFAYNHPGVGFAAETAGLEENIWGRFKASPGLRVCSG